MNRNHEQMKVREEQKRDRAWDPRARWQALQNAITWGEGQPTVLRNTPQMRLREEHAKLYASDK